MNIDEIAKIANVSKTTVSRVINQKPDVCQKTRDRINEIIAEHGFQPNASAKAIAQNKSTNIGLILPYVSEDVFLNPLNVEVLRGITCECESHGYYINLCYPHENSYLNLYRQKRVDGFILLDPRVEHIGLVEFLLKSTVPFVATSKFDSFPEVLSVSVNNYEGAKIATSHLLALGHKRIAFICKESLVVSSERLKGYCDALKQYQIPIDDNLIMMGPMATFQDGYDLMKDIIQKENRPTAAFAACDILALGAQKACQDSGLSLPKDMSMVGFDDLQIAAYVTPPLTTIHQPSYEMGIAAAKTLIEFIEKGVAPASVVLDLWLVERESSCRA